MSSPNIKSFIAAIGLSLLPAMVTISADATSNATSVLSYDQGTQQFQFLNYDNPEAALGESPVVTDVFGAVNYTSPFNNPWQAADVVSIGLGGHITLQLENYVAVSESQKEIGVFTFQQFRQTPAGGTYEDARLFYPSMQASVQVSQDGYRWVSLNNNQLMAFDLPANGINLDWQDADYGKPSDLIPQDLGGLSYSELLQQYDGSAGGNWLDLSNTGLEKIGYIRFETSADQDFSFQLEGISINNDLIGEVVPNRMLGDANGDHLIDAFDLELVQIYLGQAQSLGDVNYDGLTNLADLFEVRNRFHPPASMIPEPISLVFGLVGGFALLLSRPHHPA